MVRRLLLVLACALVALVLQGATAPPAGNAATSHDPILFVHGYLSDGSVWDTMVARFKADGWTSSELYSWSYNYSQSNAVTAGQLSQKVNEILAATGKSKVDIVTHSMGGLSSRYYLKNLGGTAKVDEWVSIGGPNHGTTTALLCFDISCVEMRPGSQFLNSLNAGDETPGAVRYGTFWSLCDEVINPDSSVLLSGATNKLTACLGHLSLLISSSVYRGVRDFVK